MEVLENDLGLNDNEKGAGDRIPKLDGTRKPTWQ